MTVNVYLILTLTLLWLSVCIAESRLQRIRSGRQLSKGGMGIDFSGCVTDPETGFCCVEKEESVKSLQKDPILECTHRNVEKCHYTYVTQFEPSQEEVCEENFEKVCQVTFRKQAVNETVRKCYKPLVKVCNGQGPEECRTLFESSCTTRYIEKQPGKFVGDTRCEKLPIDICGAGCVTEEAPEECHDKIQTSLIDIPEEICDLNPQKICKFETRLVPKLKPKPECTIIPREVCNLRFSNPVTIDKPLKTKWCQDPSAPQPDETYLDAGRPPVLTTPSPLQPPSLPTQPPQPPQTPTQPPLPTYGRTPPPARAPTQLYDAGQIRSGRTNFFTGQNNFGSRI